MNRNILILLIFIPVGKLFAQELISDGGIYIEKPDYSSTEKHRYSRDNISYKLKSTFIFDYYYIDNSGTKKKFLLSKNTTSLHLTDYQIDGTKIVIQLKDVIASI